MSRQRKLSHAGRRDGSVVQMLAELNISMAIIYSAYMMRCLRVHINTCVRRVKRINSLCGEDDSFISELKTTEDFGLKLCEECLQCSKDKLHQLIIKEKPGNLDSNLATNAELSTQTQVIISKLKSLDDAIGLQNNAVKGKVDKLSLDVKQVQKTIVDTSSKIEFLNDREKRRNNVILYNLQEKGVNPKEVVKNLLKEISEIDLETEGIEISRLGKKMEDDKKSRPVSIQFANINTKNLLLANCYKLKKSAIFNNVIVNHDLSKEERSNNRKLLEEKRKEISAKEDITKWSFRLKGKPDTLSNKFEDLQSLLGSLKCLNGGESQNFKNNRVLSEYNLQGYSSLASGFSDVVRRGLLLFFKKSLLVSEVGMVSEFKKYMTVKPTRFRFGQSANILDLVISSQDFVKNVKFYSPLGSSDHAVVEFMIADMKNIIKDI
ncbi:hypothetical protein HELRODRAFT_166789 [Helobdella robusta]|uniref:Endonuclease/exonuclease/phosphatase domain-containing protein n=1 Tax=Helobdella robusta TaxID=6412 RepID=T1EYJ3_HELRO|nr:hypothetical protein HELRODRAFT_166789 [Helobdella robusta]ESO11760.1 hypothetical protein HELRODRAFT_166789 [Helobdella robusta]